MSICQDCRECLFRRQQSKVKDVEASVREMYLREVEACIASAGEEDTAPVVVGRINLIHENYFHTHYSFDALKKKYNRVMLQRENEIRGEIKQAQEPLKQAILYARAGNYIDFGALGSVEDEKLDAILKRCKTESLDERTYKAFIESCRIAKHMAYLTDNCGEIVLDKLLIEQLKKHFPQCEITVIVRGGEVLNDATCEDAEEVGMTELVQNIVLVGCPPLKDEYDAEICAPCEAHMIEKCGHSPYMEKYAKEKFYEILLKILRNF